MNQIVFNISLVILSLGFILMVIYITTIIIKKKCKSCSPCLPCKITNNNTNTLEQIYDDRPSITYVKMFKDSNIGFGQNDFDANDDAQTSSIYFKSKK